MRKTSEMLRLLRSTVPLFLSLFAASTASAQDAGAAYDMDGIDDEVSIPHVTAYDVTSFTLEAWVEVDTVPSLEMTALASVVNRWTNESATEVFGLWIEDAGESCLRPFVAVGGVDNDGFSAGCFEAGSWHHVAAVYDRAAGEERLYVDGELVGTDAVSGVPTTSDVGMSLGVQLEGPARPFDGRMDEVRVWSVARTDEQIAGSHASCVGPGEAGLVGYWRIDADSGQTAKDDSLIANDGVLGADAAAAVDDPLRMPSAAGVACPDDDGDGVNDPFDNCPNDSNGDQSDGDNDGFGDACDPFPADPDNLTACLAELEAGTCVGLEECQADLGVCEGDLSTCSSGLASCADDLAEAEAGLAEILRLITVPPGRRSSTFSCSGSSCPLILEAIEKLGGPPGQSIRPGPSEENRSAPSRRLRGRAIDRGDRGKE